GNFTGVELISVIGNLIEGNYIGTDATGTFSLGNVARGVFLGESEKNTIGGTTAGARNVISGNFLNGVDITGQFSSHNVVQGNYIGTDASGTVAVGNGRSGVCAIWNWAIIAARNARAGKAIPSSQPAGVRRAGA